MTVNIGFLCWSLKKNKGSRRLSLLSGGLSKNKKGILGKGENHYLMYDWVERAHRKSSTKLKQCEWIHPLGYNLKTPPIT